MKQEDTTFRSVNVNYMVLERSGLINGEPFQQFIPYTDVSYGSFEADWEIHGEGTVLDDDQIPEGFYPIVVDIEGTGTGHIQRPYITKTYDEAVEVCKRHKKSFEEKGNYQHKSRVFKVEL